MSWTGLVILAVIAGICGAIAQALAGYTRGGCLMSVVLGFIGAAIGRWLAAEFHLPELFPLNVGGVDFPILWSIIGAALFVAVINFLTGRRV